MEHSCATGGAAIYYTQDGSEPSRAGTLYSNDSKPVIAGTHLTLKAIAIKDGMEDSDVLVETYTINASKVAKPAADPPGGRGETGREITLTCATEGATIRYTLDDTDPTSTTGDVYSESAKPVISENCTLKAIAYKEGMTPSDTLSEVYTVGFDNLSGFTMVLPGSDADQSKFALTMNVKGIAYGAGKFVAVGEDSNGSGQSSGWGQIAYSTDGGVTWTQVNTSAAFLDTNINGIAYGMIGETGMFVAVGQAGKIGTSTDGITWTPVENTSFGTTNVLGVGYGNGVFVAVGVGKLCWSNNGTTWNLKGGGDTNSGFASGANINGIAWGGPEDGKKFVAVGANGRMSYSENDGKNWTKIDAGTESNQSQFTSESILSIVYGGPAGEEKFIAVGVNGKMAASTDGITWTSPQTISDWTGNNIRSITWGAGQFIAAGGKQSSGAPGDGKIIVSPDGTNWTPVDITENSAKIFWGIAYGEGRFVAVADAGRLAYSNDLLGD
jgi:hypothetical protein